MLHNKSKSEMINRLIQSQVSLDSRDNFPTMKEMDDFIYYDDYANSNGVRVRGNKEF
jgi:hypothetical protein